MMNCNSNNDNNYSNRGTPYVHLLCLCCLWSAGVDLMIMCLLMHVYAVTPNARIVANAHSNPRDV